MTDLIIATIGFDERPILRAILRHGLDIKGVILIRPLGDIDLRAKKAIEAIKDIVAKASMSIVTEIVEVPVEEPYKAIGQLRKIIFEKTRVYGNDVLLVLGGGMRALVLETYTAALSLQKQANINIVVEVELENGRGYVSFYLGDIESLTLSPIEAKVLEAVVKNPGLTLTQLSSTIGLAKSTTWKALRKLVEKNLVREERIGVKKTYYPHPRAYMYVGLS